MKTPNNLVIRLDKLYQQVFVGNLFSYIVIFNLNVLSSDMEYWIGSQGALRLSQQRTGVEGREMLGSVKS